VTAVRHFPWAASRHIVRGPATPTTTDPGATSMPRPDCPRCGSELVLPARSGVPSECVFELRDDATAGAAQDGFEEWVCHFCGHRWPHVQMTGRSPSKALSDPSDLEPSPATLLIASLPDLPAAVETAEETPPGSVSTLTRARQERTLTLSEAAKATRIWECDLQALERDAPLEEFPAPAYARFFLREYAEYLGLDPAVVVNEFDERHPVREEPAFEPLPDPRPRRRIIAIALAVVSVVSLAGIALLPLGSGPKAEPTPIASAGVPEGIPGHALATRHPAGPTLRGVRAVLRLSEPCWIRAVADGRALARATLQPGGPVVYRAGHLLTLVLGNAGAADLRVNGRPIATGDLGQVMRFEFRWRHDRLFSKIV